MHALRSLFLGAIFLLAGCATTATVNHPYDTSLLRQFQPGVTTITDVERVYGAPARVLTNSQNGHTELLYAYSNVSGTVLFGSANVQHQGIAFVFDAQGKMLYYRTSAGNSQVH